MMQRIGAAVAGAAAFLAASAAAAETPGACPPRHTVQRGEYLTQLAERYFGTKQAAARLYTANRKVIGPDPDVVEVGTVLTIPCPEPPAAGGNGAEAGGAAPPPSPAAEAGVPAPGPSATAAGASAAAVARPAPPVAAAARAFDPFAAAPPAPPAVAVRERATDSGPVLLTGGPYLPFVAPGTPALGMVPELVAAAFAATDGPAAEIALVNDRPAHLAEVLPRGGFALSFPWTYPACGRDGLDAADRAVCDRFVASDALYEHVTEFYARSDGPYADAATAAALSGARICRPAGYPIEDLRRMGLLSGAVEVVRAPDPRGCLAKLDGGQADIASMDATVARYAALEMELAHPLLVLEALTRVEGLRALALRGDPAGEAAIARLNEGLRAIAAGGDWFDIVRAHLARMSGQS